VISATKVAAPLIRIPSMTSPGPMSRRAAHCVHSVTCPAATTLASRSASGVDVSLWLAAEAAWLALPGRADDIVLPHSPPMADLLASVVAGGRVTLCTQCAARRDIGPGDVIEGIRISGAATFVAEITADGTQALVY